MIAMVLTWNRVTGVSDVFCASNERVERDGYSESGAISRVFGDVVEGKSAPNLQVC